MNKKLKWAIPFAVLALTCGITAAGCGGKHEHSYTEWGYNESQHWKKCPDDNAKDDSTVENHGTPSTDGKCPDCGYQLTDPHTHAYTEWGSSVTHHWKECPDDGVMDAATKAPHGNPDAEGKCPDCGYQIQTYINQRCKLVLRKDGTNSAITSLDGVEVKLSKSGEDLVENTDYQIEKGDDNALTIKGVVSGDYTVTITTGDGEYRYSEIIKLDGSAEKEIVLQYNYAIATSQSYYVDLTHMNDIERSLGINASSVDGFWQWNAPVPEITLNLADEIKESKNVKLEFKLKAAKPNNQPNNAFGIAMTETYKGVAMSIWDTENENDGINLHNLVGQKLGCDTYSADGAATLKWLETAIYGENGVEFRVVRASNTLKYFVKNADGEWIGIKSIACPASATTDVKFMGVGSDYTITDIAVDGSYAETAKTLTATLTVLDAEGNKAEIAEGLKGLLIAGETRYEVDLTKNADDTYGISGDFVPGLYTFSIAGIVNNYLSAAVQIGDTMENITVELGDYAAPTVYNPAWAEEIQLADCVTVNDGSIAIAGNKKGGFWQWGHGNTVPAATLNLSDEIKLSRNVMVDFKLKATNPNHQPNNAFGIAMTEFHNGSTLSFWNTEAATDGIVLHELKGTWLGEDGWGDDKNGTLKWLEEAVYGGGAYFRIERDGATIELSARHNGEWEIIHETECYEYAETMVKFMGIGSDYEVSGIKVRVPGENDADEYSVNASFADDQNHGYKVTVEPILEEGGTATLVIETNDANAAWSYFPNAITVNGAAIDFSTVTVESLGANRVKYTLVISDIFENKDIVITVDKGAKVNYSASVNDDTMGSVVCDMENDGKEYYWNDACTLTLTANEGYRLKNIIIGENETAQTVTEGWTKNGKVYTYTHLVTGDIKITADFEAIPEVNLTNVKISVTDKDDNAIEIANGTEVTLTGDYNYTLTLTANGDGTYSSTATVREGTYGFSVNGVYLGYAGGLTARVVKDAETLKLQLGDVAVATKFHSGDYHGMGECDFETLIAADANTVKINTANANGKAVAPFWCWNSEVPEVSLSISDEVKNATHVQLEFNLKAANSNESPNNAFGIVMAEGYKGVNLSIWSANEKLAYYALTRNVLGNDAYGADKNTHDDWLKTAMYSATGAKIRVVRGVDKIVFYAQNGTEWTKIFATDCASDAKTDIKFLGMGSDFTVSEINITVPSDADKVEINISANVAEYGEVTLKDDTYFVNEECTVIATAAVGYELENIVIGEGDDAVTITADKWVQSGNSYAYSFVLTGDVKVVANFKQLPAATVTFAVTAKDYDGNAITPENGKEIELVSADGVNKYTYTVGGTGNPDKMVIGEYKVTCYGYADTTATVSAAGGAIAIELVKVIAYATSDEITVDSANGTIAIKGNGLSDREPNQRKINAEYVISEEVKNATDITLTFTAKATKKDNRGNLDWVGSRFGVQIGEGEIGFMVFPRNNNEGTGSDVAKLIPGTNLALNPDRDGKSEQKWHGDDPQLAWLANALYSETGAEFKVVRSNGTISIFAKNGEDWVALDTMGTQGETAGKDDIGKLTINDTVKNQIKFTAGGDNWTFSAIEVTVNEATTPVEG